VVVGARRDPSLTADGNIDPPFSMTTHRTRAAAALSLLCAATVALGSQANAAGAETCLPLAPRGTQGAALLPGGLMNVVYGGPPTEPLSLDVYPHADAAERPLAIVLRGGRGTIGQRSSYVGQLVELFGAAGFVVVAPDYRSAAEADAVSDLMQAARFAVTCHGRALRVDARRVVFAAEDSAARVAIAAGGRRVGAPRRAQPDTVVPAAILVAGGRFDGAPLTPAPPTWLVHGGADTEVPVTDARAVCARAPGRCTLVEVAGASHRAENWWPSQWGYKADVLRALEPLVGPVPRAAWPGAAALQKRVTYDAAHHLTLDAYVPPGPGPHGAVVVVHGGGWEAGDRVTYVPPMFAVAASRGLAWISIDYRLTPAVTNGEQVADVQRALQWIRSNARALRIDPSRLVLVGESASGQLVAMVASTDRDLAGVVSFYGVYDLEALAGDPASPRSLSRRLFGITALDAAAVERLRAFSPVRQVRGDMPPLLLVAGTADGLVHQQRQYAAALRAAGASHEIIEIEGAPHGMEAWHDDPLWHTWEAHVGTWIAARVGAQRP
jgi:acetyl esterase